MGLFGSSKNSKRVLANLTVKDLHVPQPYRMDAWFDDQRGLEEVVVPRAASLIKQRFRVCYLVLVFREVCFVEQDEGRLESRPV
jgi:hypothetical protein